MLDYNEFKEILIKQIQSELQESIRLQMTSVKKNNSCEKEGVTFTGDNNNLCPGIYFQDLYEYYQEENDLVECVNLVFEFMKSKQVIQNAEILNNWDLIKSKVRMEVINKKWNEELLVEVPFREMCDLAVICRVIFHEDEEGRASCLVKKDMLRLWNISEGELWDAAYENLKEYDFCVRKMRDVLSAFFEEIHTEDDEQNAENEMMYVISNVNYIGGAAGILRADILSGLSEKYDSDLYILPSSIHELILLPVSEEMCAAELKQMVMTVNRECVAPEEQLSNKVYCFRKKERKIEIAAQ